MNNNLNENFTLGVSPWLRRVGVRSWLFVGVVLATTFILGIMTTLSQIVTSLIVSLLLAILSRPLVDWLERHKVSRSLGTILTMVLILLGLIGLLVIVIKGVVQQGTEITYQLQAGWIGLQSWLAGYNVQLPAVNDVINSLQDTLPAIFEGVFGFVGSTLSSVLEFFVGFYFSIFILFFLLRDITKIEAWIAKLISREHEVGTSIIRDAGHTVLVYFRGTALTALITSVVVAIPLIVLRVPLVGSILILYFVTSFIPYLGAWIAGAFAVLIALGAGGIPSALIILIAVIVSNGVLQSVVSSWALGSMLKMHPLLIFLTTIIAGVVGGVLLMILAVPMTAIVIQLVQRLYPARLIPE